MHRHGTLRGRWKALAFGAAWFLVGAFLVRHVAADLFAGAAPRPPGWGELGGIFVGGMLVLLGGILGLTPHVIWLLRTFYKEDFARGAFCPVMLVCAGCAAYNPRGRARCKTCGASLAGARAAGGEAPTGAAT